jgi:hypothetical protein
VFGDERVDLGCVRGDSFDEFGGVRRNRRVAASRLGGQDVADRYRTQVRLVEDVERPLAGLGPGAQLVTRPR